MGIGRTNAVVKIGSDVSAGYLTINDGIVTFHDVTNGTTEIVDNIYIPNTGVAEPTYGTAESNTDQN